MWVKKHLISMDDLSVEEITQILDTAEMFRVRDQDHLKTFNTLKGKTVVNLFYEPSTRTRTSFEIAAKRLGADTVNFAAESSSVGKGETLLDTVRNIEAMHPSVIVVRHPLAGTPMLLSKRVKVNVVNAGDGAHEHPSQALLDMMMIRDVKKDFKDLEIAIIGDIAHSRVARSNIIGLKKMGANVRVAGPPTLVPKVIEKLGVTVEYDVDKAIRDCDVIMMLRIQLERQSQRLFPSKREYARFFGLNAERLELAKPDAIIMHPGPMNRGVEISSEVADSSRSKILGQVSNGVAVRMAILYLLSGGGKENENGH